MVDGCPPPLVSVITPSFNAARFIRETIQSVLDQDYPRLEHIVVDGGSTDGTVEILQEYPHLRWISEPDQGQSDALNKGFRLAQGEIIGWLNADDVYTPGAVTAAVALLHDQSSVSVVYGDCAISDADGRQTGLIASGPFDLAEQVLGNQIPQPSVFVRHSAIEAAGGVDQTLHYAMDYDLWLRLAAGGYVFVHLNRVQARFRVCAGTKTVEHADRFWPEILRSYGRLFASPNLPSKISGLKERATDRALWQAGLAYFAVGDATRGREMCSKAVSGGRLIETDADWAAIALIEQGLNDATGRGAQYARAVIGELGLPHKYRWFAAHFAPARLQEALAFARFRERDMVGVRKAMAECIVHDPSRIRNLGLLSIGIEAMLGGRTASLRHLARQLGLNDKPKSERS